MLLRSLLPLSLAALLLSSPVAAVDLEKGKEINGTCAACHSENGQGGVGSPGTELEFAL